MDGHGSRFNPKYLLFLLHHHILVYILFPNSTHLTCILDQLPFKEFNRNRRINLQLAHKHCSQHSISYNIVHEAIVVARSMYQAVGTNTTNVVAGLKLCGYIPWNPDRVASTLEGLQYDNQADEQEKAAANRQAQKDTISPYQPTQKQKIRQYLHLGGLITDPAFIKVVISSATKKSKK